MVLPPDPASRTTYVAGEVAQNDFWFPEITLPVGFGQTRTAKQLPVLTMGPGYSRLRSAVLVPSRAAEGLFPGGWALLPALGAVPRGCVWGGRRPGPRVRPTLAPWWRWGPGGSEGRTPREFKVPAIQDVPNAAVIGPGGVPVGPTAAEPPGRKQVLYRHTLGREDRASREALRRLTGRMPDKRPKRR